MILYKSNTFILLELNSKLYLQFKDNQIQFNSLYELKQKFKKLNNSFTTSETSNTSTIVYDNYIPSRLINILIFYFNFKDILNINDIIFISNRNFEMQISYNNRYKKLFRFHISIK